MVSNDDVNRQLIEMGRIDVVGPSRDFVDSLGQRLEVMASTRAEYAPHLIPPRRMRPRRVIFAPAFVALVLAVGAIVFVADKDSSAYALDDPFNVQVQFADGHFVDATDGLKVPKGATVVVGAGGTVRIRDRVYREGDVIVIGEGGPEVAQRVQVTAPPMTRHEPTVPTTEGVEPTRPSTSAPPTTLREPEPTVAPRPVEPAPTTRSEVPESTRAPEPTRPATTTRTVVSIELAASRVESSSQVSLSWSAVEGAVKYVVVRTVAVGGTTPAEPMYPLAAPTKLVVQTTTRAHVDVADAVEGVPITAARYRVVALDATAKVIGSSRFVQVNLPR